MIKHQESSDRPLTDRARIVLQTTDKLLANKSINATCPELILFVLYEVDASVRGNIWQWMNSVGLIPSWFMARFASPRCDVGREASPLEHVLAIANAEAEQANCHFVDLDHLFFAALSSLSSARTPLFNSLETAPDALISSARNAISLPDQTMSIPSSDCKPIARLCTWIRSVEYAKPPLEVFANDFVKMLSSTLEGTGVEIWKITSNELKLLSTSGETECRRLVFSDLSDLREWSQVTWQENGGDRLLQSIVYRGNRLAVHFARSGSDSESVRRGYQRFIAECADAINRMAGPNVGERSH